MNSTDNQKSQFQNHYQTNQSNIQNSSTQNLNSQIPINFQSQSQSGSQSQMFQSNQYIIQQQQQPRGFNQHPQTLPSRQISSQPMYPPKQFVSYSNDQQNLQQIPYNPAFQNQNVRPATPESFNNQSINISAYNLDKPQLQSAIQSQLPLHIQNQTQNSMVYNNSNIPRPMLYPPTMQYQSKDGSMMNRMGTNMLPYPSQTIYPPVRIVPQQQQQQQQLHYSRSNPNIYYQQPLYQQQIQYQQPFYQQQNQNQNQNQNQINYQQSQQVQPSSSISSSISSSSSSAPYNVVRTAVPWSEEESILLMKLRDRGLTWKEIASHFTNRTLNACQFRWKRISLNGGIEFESSQNNSEIDNNKENNKQKEANEEKEGEEQNGINKDSIIQKEEPKDGGYSKNEESKIVKDKNKLKLEQKIDSKVDKEIKENKIVNPEDIKETDEQKASNINEKGKNNKEDSNIEDESINEKKLHGLKRSLETKEKNTQKYKFKKMKIKNSNKIDNLLNSTSEEVKKISNNSEKREIEWVSNNSSINIKSAELKSHNST